MASLSPTLLGLLCGVVFLQCSESIHPKYEGCFQFNNGKLYDFEAAPIGNFFYQNSDIAVEMCIQACKANNFRKAGKQQTLCYCGNSTSNDVQLINQACDYMCDSERPCGFSGGLSVYSAEPEYSGYVGCYGEAVDYVYALYWWNSNQETTANTIGVCNDTCYRNNFKYTGLSEGYCYCGNMNYDRWGETLLCATSCPGTTTEICGGPDQISVYDTGIPEGSYDPRHIGCWTFGAVTAFQAWSNDQTTTIQSCIKRCAGTYLYAALSAGSDCYCSNDIAWVNNPPLDGAQCNLNCVGGGPTGNCGGPDATSVYYALCAKGTWGSNCEECHCRGGVQCDATSGVCPSGVPCADGWIGQSCNQKCDFGKWGSQCAKDCSGNCVNGQPCDHIDGTCPAGSCAPGYRGIDCSEQCPTGTYGDRCTLICNCPGGSNCNHVNGLCAGQECQPGRMGIRCETSCVSPMYGANCLKECHCRNGAACNIETGACPNELCAAGWQGFACSNKCPEGKYGENCVGSCQCKNHVECNFQTGVCEGGHCQPGWTGTDCNTECPHPNFGQNCSFTCNCLNNARCDNVEGDCPNLKCAKGWFTASCSIECSNGKFGENCQKFCHCLNDQACNVVTGACPNNQCAQFYTGPDCQSDTRQCAVSYFGSDCLSRCYCFGDVSCDKSTGACPRGCSPDYRGATCSEYIGTPTPMPETTTSPDSSGSSNTNVKYIMYAAIAGAAVILLAVIIAICVCCSWKSKESNMREKAEMDYEGIDNFRNDGSRLLPASRAGHLNSVHVVPPTEQKNNCGHITKKDINSEEISDIKVNKEDSDHAKNPSHRDFDKSGQEINNSSNITNIEINNIKGENMITEQESDGTLSDKENNCLHNMSKQDLTPKMKKTKRNKQIGSYENYAIRRPVRVPHFLEYYCNKMNEEAPFRDEYMSIPEGKTAEWTTGATLPGNRAKNRFKDIIAFDHSLVRIGESDKSGGYINANYIKNYKSEKAFIATQGPTPLTVNDFWQMIWEQRSPNIVMLTRLVEKGKKKCEKYWPEKDNELDFNGICVKLTSDTNLHEYCIRQLKVSKDNEVRVVNQFHFTTWPDHGVPSYSTPLLNFLRIVRVNLHPEIGPTVVHCSAGVGRTGTLITLDFLLDQAEAEDVVDIYSCVNLLRADRVNMVQTLDQYKFIHRAILEATWIGDTTVAVEDFSKVVEQLTYIDKGGDQMEKQFDLLQILTPVFDDDCFKIAKSKENRKKNRTPKILPADLDIVSFQHEMVEEGDYINAVYVDGYSERKTYIATQLPLERTQADLWRLVWDLQCFTVISLHHIDNKPSSQYWPAPGMTKKAGSFEISCLNNSAEGQSISAYDLSIHIKTTGDHKVCLYHLDMKNGDTSVLDFIRLRDLVKENLDSFGKHPVIIQCLDGADHCGFLTACFNLMDQISQDKELDVYQIVQKIRKTRPQFITDQQQYRLLYKSMLDYLENINAEPTTTAM